MRVKLPAEQDDYLKRPAYIKTNDAGVAICENRCGGPMFAPSKPGSLSFMFSLQTAIFGVERSNLAKRVRLFLLFLGLLRSHDVWITDSD